MIAILLNALAKSGMRSIRTSHWLYASFLRGNRQRRLWSALGRKNWASFSSRLKNQSFSSLISTQSWLVRNRMRAQDAPR